MPFDDDTILDLEIDQDSDTCVPPGTHLDLDLNQ